MRIVNLKAENVKRLVAVEITPDGDVVRITGKNGAGKTSVMDAIWWALGGERHIQGQPVRRGQDKAQVQLDLGDLTVRRRWSKKGTTLAVSNKDGAVFKSPQSMLDRLLGKLTFDPLAFMRLRPAEQATQLRDLVELDVDIDEIDREYQRLYDERRDVNRQEKQLAAQAEGVAVVEDAPDEEQSLTDAMEAVQEAERHNREIEDLGKQLEAQREDYRGKQARIKELKEEIAHLEAQLPDVEKRANDIKARLERAERKDVEALRAALTTLEERNRQARAKQKRTELEAERGKHAQRSEEITTQMQELVNRKSEALASASFPLEGLSFGEGGVTYNDLPLDQASSAEQLRVAMAIAMAANPEIRVIRITDGSLLDSDSLQIIEEMASEQDFQVWLETVSDAADVGVIIEDGQIKESESAA